MGDPAQRFLSATQGLDRWLNQNSFRYNITAYQREYQWEKTQVETYVVVLVHCPIWFAMHGLIVICRLLDDIFLQVSDRSDAPCLFLSEIVLYSEKSLDDLVSAFTIQ